MCTSRVLMDLAFSPTRPLTITEMRVFRLATERPLRTLGRSMPSSLARALTRSQPVRSWYQAWKSGPSRSRVTRLPAAPFPVDIRDAATAFGELLMCAGGCGRLGKEPGRLPALRALAVGRVELFRGMHGQADGATRRAVRQASERRFALLVERQRRDAAMTSGRLRDIAGILGRISREIGGKLVQGQQRLPI